MSDQWMYTKETSLAFEEIASSYFSNKISNKLNWVEEQILRRNFNKLFRVFPAGFYGLSELSN